MTFQISRTVSNYGVSLVCTTEDTTLNDASPDDYSWKGIYGAVKFSVARKTDHSEYHIGDFFLNQFPGNNEIVVVTGVKLLENNRHSGLSNDFRLIRQDVAKALGFKVMLGTVAMNNYPALGSFMKVYTLFHSFVSLRGKAHSVALGFKELE